MLSNLSLLTGLRGAAARALRGNTTGLGQVSRGEAGEACPQGVQCGPQLTLLQSRDMTK